MDPVRVGNYTLQKSSEWGINDPDFSRLWLLTKELVKYLDSGEDTRDELDFAADRIKDELETALVHYQTITSTDFKEFTASRRRAAYESYYSDLWTLYKDRMQKYLKCVGIDIGFLFAKNDKDFDKKSKKFIDDNPDNTSFIQFAKSQRNSWQNDFANYRNAHEHEGDLRGGVKDFDNPIDAKRMFAQIYWTMETIIACLVSWKLRKEYNVVEVNHTSTCFDRCKRYSIEHYLVTQRNNSKGDDNE